VVSIEKIGYVVNCSIIKMEGIKGKEILEI
jgi:hypothetical protein